MYRRLAEARVADAIEDTPVVVVQGPRQCGKSTLVQQFCVGDVPYITLDDGLSLDAATRNPDAFIARFRGPAVLDEVQRAPGLFRAIKKSVDQNRTPGRFLLTGSSNVLLLPKLSESLAGRMEIVPLWPLAQSEIESSEGSFLDWAFSHEQGPCDAPETDLTDRILAGGFPEPLGRQTFARKAAWFESYLKTIAERDVRDLADIEGLTAMPRLLRVMAHHTGETVNVSRLSRETGIPHTTLTRYLALLESVFLLCSLPAWESDSGVRTIKSSKLHFSDPGLLAHLLGADIERLELDQGLIRRLLESFVAMELVRLADAHERSYRVLHFRSVRQWSVPVVIQAPDGRIVGIDLSS
ncbi:MAG: ATP-binding protein, partial [Armatimonadetes bacterium]|nr:ATP-binding protein [Armatimonadota bacterium]